MEEWFFFSLLSAFGAGFEAFSHKIAANRNVDIKLLSLFTSIISCIFIFTIIFYDSNEIYISGISIIFAFLGSFTYLIALNFKVNSLKYIDASIFFPLYKVIGPSIVVIIGLLFFYEKYSLNEWLGLSLSISIPFLLISKYENRRQLNLIRGILFLCFSAFFSSISISLYKNGSNTVSNVFIYVLFCEFFMFFSAFIAVIYKYKFQSFNLIYNEIFLSNLQLAIFMAVAQVVSTTGIIFAFYKSGNLAIVYGINSLYIVIPVFLSVIFYKEHFNINKFLALVVSILALFFFR